MDELEVFTPEWIACWQEELATSSAYQRAAAKWEGSLVLVLLAPPGVGFDDRVAFLDLHRGACREARMGSATDRQTADFVLIGTPSSWRAVLDGADPLLALMSGKLKLERGSLSRLTPYVQAARELVAAAARAGGRFPEGYLP